MSELSKEQVHGLAIRLVAAIRNRSFRAGHDVIEWEERIYGEDARIAELVLKDFGITGRGTSPVSVPWVYTPPYIAASDEIKRLHQQRDELLQAAKAALHYMRLHKYADQAWADDLERAIARAEGRSDE